MYVFFLFKWTEKAVLFHRIDNIAGFLDYSYCMRERGEERYTKNHVLRESEGKSTKFFC